MYWLKYLSGYANNPLHNKHSKKSKFLKRDSLSEQCSGQNIIPDVKNPLHKKHSNESKLNINHAKAKPELSN